VINGAGAAGLTVSKFLVKAGVKNLTKPLARKPLT
jgi:malic enzyme